MAEQDLYDPTSVFENEEDDVLLAKVALDDLIRNTAVKALNEGLNVLYRHRSVCLASTEYLTYIAAGSTSGT